MELIINKRLEQFNHIVNRTEVTATNAACSLENGINNVYQDLIKVRELKSNLYIIGNGGSAAVASHAAIDFMNIGKISAHTLHEPAMMTCMTNDYGYEYAFSTIIQHTLRAGDLLIAISSSGQSRNIINAVQAAKEKSAKVITLSGFEPNNHLRKLGEINFWNNSKDYGMVEIAHQFILHNFADRLQHMKSNNK